MFELSKMFLLCLNYWKLETPTQYRQRPQKDDGTAYKVDYTRCVHVLLTQLLNNIRTLFVLFLPIIHVKQCNIDAMVC